MDLNNIIEQINWAQNGTVITYGLIAVLLLILILLAIKAKTPLKFIKSVFDEAKKVEWLNKKDLMFYSAIVIAFLILSTVFVALVDIGLINGRTLLLISNIF